MIIRWAYSTKSASYKLVVCKNKSFSALYEISKFNGCSIILCQSAVILFLCVRRLEKNASGRFLSELDTSWKAAPEASVVNGNVVSGDIW